MTWTSNEAGHRADPVNQEDHPFDRYQYAYPLRRAVEAETLRDWVEEPADVAAQPRLLCDMGFADRQAWLDHVDEKHGGLQRYRNAFLYLESLCPHVVRGQEVRLYVSNYATFLRYGAMDWERDFVRRIAEGEGAEALLRARVGCVFCARSFWTEELELVRLQGRRGFMQSPQAVWKLLSIERYRSRWPMIPFKA